MNAPDQRHVAALLAVPAYEARALREAVERAIEAASGGMRLAGLRALVKPNWVAPRRAALACTNPLFLRAVAEALIDRGARVTVGDSPAFGAAERLAAATGSDVALRGLPARIVNFTAGPALRFSFGASTRLAREAAESDLIVSVPKLKAHSQLRLTAAVKNFFGCVVGARKALIHAVHGDRDNRFGSVIIEVMLALQPSLTIVDGIEAMSVTGPMNGEPVWLGAVAAGQNPVAVDTALYTMLRIAPDQAPLWREARARNLPGAGLDQLRFPLAAPEDFDTRAFQAPRALDPLAFKPGRLAVSMARRLWRRVTGR